MPRYIPPTTLPFLWTFLTFQGRSWGFFGFCIFYIFCFVSVCLTLSHFVSGAQATGQRAREAEPTEAAKIRASAREKDTKLICQTHRSDRNTWHKYVTQTDIKSYKHYVLLTHGQGDEHGLACCYHNAWLLDWIVRRMQTMAREINMNKRPAP